MACLLPPQLYMNAEMENDGPKSGAEKNDGTGQKAVALRSYANMVEIYVRYGTCDLLISRPVPQRHLNLYASIKSVDD